MLLRNNLDGKEPNKETFVNFSRNGQKLVFEFFAKDSKFFCPYTTNNQELWHGDVVEVFIRFGEKFDKYFEVEIAPNGCIFFALITYKNGNFTFETMSNFPKFFVTKTQNDYKVLVEINLYDLFGNENISDDNLYINLFRIDGKNTDTPLRSALSPTLKNTFHCPEKMIQLSKIIN